MISQQKARVDQLSALANAKSLQVSQHKRALRAWRRQKLGRPAIMLGIFAAGAWIGLGRAADISSNDDKPKIEANSSKSGSIKSTLGLVNASLLTWRYLNKPLNSTPES